MMSDCGLSLPLLLTRKEGSGKLRNALVVLTRSRSLAWISDARLREEAIIRGPKGHSDNYCV